MKFSIITSTNETERTIKNFDVVEKEINNCKDKEDFVILNNDPAISNSIYLQTMLSGKNQYTLEIRFEYENDFSQYGIEEVTKNDCLEIFKHYFEGRLPDLNEWEDITKYVRQHYYNTEIGLNQETVHPSYYDYFKADFYYSISDFYTPFGNDAGFDAMIEAEKFLKSEDSNNFYLIQLIDEINIENYDYDEKRDYENLHFLVHDHNAIVAIGFTNLKVNGFIMEDVKEKTLSSLRFLNQVQNHENYQIMIEDLNKIEAETYGE
ncbi:hypothetical protein [Flavobacterium foetidum]|uniref:hypothetical protein n=1 Tax=Flavobacterium foetidum TaxID=2026681 RepID=UPI001074F156|nr:hypothetical protein [Flavobacterium foetidum]KAF2509125.1 hypothetical protein E0W73_19145 [Flavobacterium foetidum]